MKGLIHLFQKFTDSELYTEHNSELKTVVNYFET